MSALLKSVVDGTAPGIVLLQVDQFHRMLSAGILPKGSAIELIDGFLIPRERATQNNEARTTALNARHANLVSQIQALLTRVLTGAEFHVQAQRAITLGPLHELIPDLAVIRGATPPTATATGQPQRVGVAMVIEVADTSLNFVRAVKGRVYAMAGIPHYLIINLVDGNVESYSGPDPAQQRFATGEIINREGTLTVTTGTGEPVVLQVRDLLPE